MKSFARGFSLVETAVASVVLLVVAGTLALSVRAFSRGQEGNSCRRTALMIAAEEMAGAEASRDPVPSGTRSETVDGLRFDVDVWSSPDSAGTNRLVVTVTGPRGGPVTLERRFILPKGTVWR